MKVDYICYCVPEIGKTFYQPSPSDDENIEWVKRTDLAQMKKAAKNDFLIVYSCKDKAFYKNGKPFDVKGKTILPKVVLFREKELLKALDDAGANNLCSLQACQEVGRWPNYFQPVHRKAYVTTYGDFKKKHKKIKESFGENIFIKTTEKSSKHYFLDSFSEIDFGGEKFFYTHPPIFDMNDEEEIFISKEYFQIDDRPNNTNCKEYRAFVLDGEILSFSRSYVEKHVEIPDKVLSFAKSVVACVAKTDFPKNYVIDFGEMLVDGKKVVDIVECNSISASGLEIDHDIVEAVLQKNKEDKGIKFKTNEGREF